MPMHFTAKITKIFTRCKKKSQDCVQTGDILKKFKALSRGSWLKIPWYDHALDW